MDARRTGSSEGSWCGFCTREDQDAGEVLTWAAQQSWSNGSTAMDGPSYMGIDQIFAAADQPTGLKAIFPQVPAADVYRDVVSAGGELDAGFIPLWLGLVSVAGLVPPAVTATDPTSGLTSLVQHLSALATFTLPLLTEAVAGQETAYDGAFYAQRSLPTRDRGAAPAVVATSPASSAGTATPATPSTPAALASTLDVQRHGRTLSIAVPGGNGAAKVRVDRGRWLPVGLSQGCAQLRLAKPGAGRHAISVRYGTLVSRLVWRVR